MRHIYIIGGGGVGSWLLPAILKLATPSPVTIIDGDRLEEKNLDRQLFDEAETGNNKAEALSRKYDCHFRDTYYSDGQLELDDLDWLMVCADNNAARLSAYTDCNRSGCKMIIGCNETTSAEAYYYQPSWSGSVMDPSLYYPEIRTDKAEDPRAAAIGCTGQAQSENVQLVSANISAASLMLNLYVCWAIEGRKLDREGRRYLPYMIRQHLTNYELYKQKDIK